MPYAAVCKSTWRFNFLHLTPQARSPNISSIEVLEFGFIVILVILFALVIFVIDFFPLSLNFPALQAQIFKVAPRKTFWGWKEEIP